MQPFPNRIARLQPFWGQWYLRGLLGSGAYGRVYHITREECGRTYHAALKWISIPLDPTDMDMRRREGYSEKAISDFYSTIVNDFRNEISLMMELKRCPCIVGYEDHAVIQRANEPGWDVLIRMELLKPLNKAYAEGMSVFDVIQLGIDVCQALTVCHARHIIHRDIKPDNLFVNRNGVYCVGDFGVARHLEATSASLSQQGTPLYMAPEVYRGQSHYDQTVDTYALGLVMHRLLNRQCIPFIKADGHVPTQPERMHAIEMRMQGAAIPPPVDGGEVVASVLAKACAFQPNHRFSTARAMQNALCAAAEQTHEDARLQAKFIAPVQAPSQPLNRSRSATPATVINKNDLSTAKPSSSVEIIAREQSSASKQTRCHNPTNPNKRLPRKPRWMIACVAAALFLAAGGIWIIKSSTPNPNIMFFPNEIVEQAIRRELEKPTGDVLKGEVAQIATLDLSETQLSNIDFLTDFSGLRRLWLQGNDIVDLSPLAGLTGLVELALDHNDIEDVSPLRNLLELKSLWLDSNRVSDILPLSNMSNLEWLDLSDNAIVNVEPLRSLNGLETLGLSGNSLQSIEDISDLENLRALYVDQNMIADLKPLERLASLETLYISGNQGVDVVDMTLFPKLTDFDF